MAYQPVQSLAGNRWPERELQHQDSASMMLTNLENITPQRYDIPCAPSLSSTGLYYPEMSFKNGDSSDNGNARGPSHDPFDTHHHHHQPLAIESNNQPASGDDCQYSPEDNEDENYVKSDEEPIEIEYRGK